MSESAFEQVRTFLGAIESLLICATKLLIHFFDPAAASGTPERTERVTLLVLPRIYDSNGDWVASKARKTNKTFGNMSAEQVFKYIYIYIYMCSRNEAGL